MAASIEVSVEAVIENQVQEVTLDGQEKYVQPLSMSENLTKLAHKIDFSKDDGCDDKVKPVTDGESVEDDRQQSSFQASQWPWDSVRNRLRAALTETSVLLDVLQICKEKRYMIFDAVQGEMHDTKSPVHLVAKKRSLAQAGNALLRGAERLQKSTEGLAHLRRSQTDFHTELLKLRQNWKLKKVGNMILGDLSYKSAGSKYWQSGTFEVTKSEADAEEMFDAMNQPCGSLQVTVPSELEGVAYIQVSIRKLSDNTDLASFDIQNVFGGPVPTNLHYQRKLDDAQNVIFCKEIFAQLAREAVQIESKSPHMVVGNHLCSHLFPGIQIVITLVHNSDKDRKVPTSPQKPDHNHVLEHSLHQLLRELHHRNSNIHVPRPVTALLGMSKKRRMAGPHGLTRKELLELNKNEPMLEQIVKQGKHFVLRHRTISVLDEMAMSMQDPQITVHWGMINTASEAMVKVSMASIGHESHKTYLVVHIGIEEVKVTCKDGRVIHLSYEEQCLRDLLMCQIAQHHMMIFHNLAKLMGWQVLASSTNVGVGDMETCGNAASMMAASPSGNRVIAIRSGPSTGVRVFIQFSPRAANEAVPSSLSVVKDVKWLQLGGEFKEVSLSSLEGKNLANKVEMLMACLEST